MTQKPTYKQRRTATEELLLESSVGKLFVGRMWLSGLKLVYSIETSTVYTWNLLYKDRIAI